VCVCVNVIGRTFYIKLCNVSINIKEGHIDNVVYKPEAKLDFYHCDRFITIFVSRELFFTGIVPKPSF